MPRIRRTSAVVAATAVTALALAACGSGGARRAGRRAGGPVELKVSLFGTFGYDEVGLFRQYEAEHPGIKIVYESTQGEDKYWPALQTRLSSGAGVADVQGIEVARIADVTANQADQWTDLRDTPAKDAIGRYIAWKEPAATTADGAVLGLGTDIGPMGICYRTRPARPGRAAHRPDRAGRPDAELGRVPGARREVQGGRAGRQRLARLRRRALQRDHLHPAGDLLRPRRPAGLRQEPGRARRVRHRGPGRAERADRQARAVRRPGLGRRASPPAASPPSPARPG